MQSDTRFRLYLGHKIGKGSEGTTVPCTEIDRTLRRIVDVTQGATFYDATGYYEHDDGTRIRETTTIVETLGSSENFGKIRAIAEDYALRNGQESVLLTREPVTFHFVTPRTPAQDSTTGLGASLDSFAGIIRT